MRRAQKGSLFQKAGRWYVRYATDRVINGEVTRQRVSNPLAEGVTKRKARELANELLAALNHTSLPAETAIKLSQFVETVYFPRIGQRNRPSTLRGYRTMWEQLKPYCANLWIREVKTRHVQTILDNAATTNRFNTTTLGHLKSFLSGIFRLGGQLGYCEGNPVRETSRPQGHPASETVAYSLEEVIRMVDVVPEPASTMIATAAFSGLRRGELRGLLWENYSGVELFVARSIWNGRVTDPKSRKAKAAIPVIGWLANRLEQHRARLGSPTSGPMFPNAAENAVDWDSVLRRQILPSLNLCTSCNKTELEHCRETHKYERNKSLPEWHGWHAFRRGLATNLHRLGVDDKTIQAILRHSNVAVTQACYIKTLPQSSVEAMAKLDAALSIATQLPPKPTIATPKVVM
jgi:integrase